MSQPCTHPECRGRDTCCFDRNRSVSTLDRGQQIAMDRSLAAGRIADVSRQLRDDHELARLIVVADDALLAYADLHATNKRNWENYHRLQKEERDLRKALAACRGEDEPGAVRAWREKFVEMDRAEGAVASGLALPVPRCQAEEALGAATRAVQDHLLQAYLRGSMRDALR